MEPRTDEELVDACAREPDAFAAFYRRHARPLAGFFVRRTGDPELAADLTAETFAAALEGSGRFDPRRGSAAGWLYGIARHQLSGAQRRGRVEDRARRRLGMEPLVLDDEALSAIASCDVDLSLLPPDQRDAVRARVVDERPYAEIARAARTSESVIRQRVSRGLARLRAAHTAEEPPA
ncbi:MAG TPA: sigma-70 family RNA polymerase sigma factor [Solirubrobacteraceae bacterium]|jgi:RNA polymerase sigma-70 factor (ECF subfamily)